MENKFKAVLFDMDGVLVNSEHYIMKASRKSLKQWGINAKNSDFVEFIGAGENRFVGGVAEKYGVPFVPKMKDDAYKFYAELVEKENIACKNAVSLLKWVKKNGMTVAICSSADLVKVRVNIKALKLTEDFFDLIISGLDVKNKKPNPEIYNLAAEKLGLSPDDCIVVEDALNGVISAHGAGMKCIAYTSSFSREELEEKVHADYIIDDLAEAKKILRQ